MIARARSAPRWLVLVAAAKGPAGGYAAGRYPFSRTSITVALARRLIRAHPGRQRRGRAGSPGHRAGYPGRLEPALAGPGPPAAARAAALPDDRQGAGQRDGKRQSGPAPGQGPGRGQARGQQRTATARGGNQQQPQAAQPGLPAAPAHAAAAVPKVRAVWRRASSDASSRLIAKVPGCSAVHCRAVAGLVKCST